MSLGLMGGPPALSKTQLEKLEAKRHKATWTGMLLFIITLMVFLSSFKAYRIPIGSLLVHAYLIPLGLLGLFCLFTRLAYFPRHILVWISIFTVLYSFSTSASPGALEESAKIIGGMATIVIVALLVRSEADFRLGSLGLIFSISALAALALLWKHDSFDGADSLDMSNENGFSLYTLPPLLLGSALLFERKGGKYWVMVLPCILTIVVAMFSNANRSGWLCIGIIFLMQLWRPKTIRIIPWFLLLGLAGYLAVDHFADKKLMQLRFEETVSGKTADHLRVELFVAAVEIGMEYPILGITPQQVMFALADKIMYRHAIDAHNVFGYVIAGCGLIIFSILIYIGWLLWRRPPSERKTGLSRLLPFSGSPHFRLLRMMLVLWFVRGNFSREVLYAPAFCIGLGLVIGLCITHGMWVKPAKSKRPLPKYQPLALGTP
jgi:hypothetical protein